jgi:hypothetical protein
VSHSWADREPQQKRRESKTARASDPEVTPFVRSLRSNPLSTQPNTSFLESCRNQPGGLVPAETSTSDARPKARPGPRSISLPEERRTPEGGVLPRGVTAGRRSASLETASIDEAFSHASNTPAATTWLASLDRLWAAARPVRRSTTSPPICASSCSR